MPETISPKYPKKCSKCGKKFKPGDRFWYDMLGDDPSLDNLCFKCARNISMMTSELIPKAKRKRRA
jgi:hypothetical protein